MLLRRGDWARGRTLGPGGSTTVRLANATQHAEEPSRDRLGRCRRDSGQTSRPRLAKASVRLTVPTKVLETRFDHIEAFADLIELR